MKHLADLHRLLAIIMHLQNGRRCDPATLAGTFGVTRRTIFRDVEKLRASGVPIAFDHIGQTYHIAGEFTLKPLQLTPEEALALAAVCEQVARTEQIPFLRPAAKALEKIRAQLPQQMDDELARATSELVIRTAPAAPADGHADVYERLRAAIAKRMALECEYESPRRKTTERFIFEPYALFYGVRAWYAIGRHLGHDQVRCLKLKRFGPIRESDRKYRIPAGFSVRGYLRNAWAMVPGDKDYSVELLLDPSIAELLSDTQWHLTQQIEEHPDGSATFRCTVSGLDEIVWWVLSLGPSCKVVKPKALADRVRDLAKKTAAVYTRSRA
jgi:predicted DNA-binding transcriptional regulator YafY